MSEITAITPQIKDKDRCNIYVDGKFYCGLKLETALKYRLKVGEIVETVRLDEIQLENEKSQALDKAMTHLSATMKTEKQMRDFLQKKGYVGAVCDYVLEKLIGYGFVDDEEYCRQYIRSAGKGKGPRMIASNLRSRGVSSERIERALEEFTGEEEACKAVLDKYMKNRGFTRENLAKAYRYLISKGFGYDAAKDALASLREETEE